MKGAIVLVRHAQPYSPAADGPDDFHRGLSPAGLDGAEALAPSLAAMRPSTIVSSPYLRAIQTVRPAARLLSLPVATYHDLREWDSGLSIRPDYADDYAASWRAPNFARPDGESLNQLTERAVAALTLLLDTHEGTVIVGSHGTFVARALAGFGVDVDWPFASAMPMPAVYTVEFCTPQVVVRGPGLP